VLLRKRPERERPQRRRRQQHWEDAGLRRGSYVRPYWMRGRREGGGGRRDRV
jgi:hypothetical protein